MSMHDLTILLSGILISVVGIINIRGNVSTIRYRHRRKVREEDLPKYGRAIGTGNLITGVALILSSFPELWDESTKSSILLLAVSISFGFVLYGQLKYNHRFF